LRRLIIGLNHAGHVKGIPPEGKIGLLHGFGLVIHPHPVPIKVLNGPIIIPLLLGNNFLKPGPLALEC